MIKYLIKYSNNCFFFFKKKSGESFAPHAPHIRVLMCFSLKTDPMCLLLFYASHVTHP